MTFPSSRGIASNTRTPSRGMINGHTPLVFQPGDRVWLSLDKHRFRGQHHKLHPLRYGPYTMLERIGENAYRLDLPPQLGIHDVLNVNNLKLFEPPLLEETITVHHPVDNIPYFQPPLLTDTILDSQTHNTRQQHYVSYLVGRKGQTPAQAKWMSPTTLQRSFPHLLAEAGTLPDLNREELGHQRGHPSSLHSCFYCKLPSPVQLSREVPNKELA
jgi:hypothetical protein